MIGFLELRNKLKKASLDKRIAHAHLIAGPDGIGKSVFSKDLAKIILHPEVTNHHENYVDIIEIRNDKNSIGVEEVRKIVSEANVKPFEGDKKVIVIYDAQKMTVQAQNAILKTIEEPIEGVFFIFIVESVEDVLPTIRSRTQAHRLSPLSNKEMDEYITLNFNLNDEAKEKVKAIACGIPGKADEFINKEEFRNFLDLQIETLECLAKSKSLKDKQSVSLLELNKKILQYDLNEFFNSLISLSRDLLLLKVGQDYKRLIFLYNKERLESLSQKFSIRRLNGVIEVCKKALFLLEPGKNINKETIIDYILLAMLEES